MTILTLDTETFSEEPIQSGTFRYAEAVEVMLITYAIDDGEPQCIDLTAGESIEKLVVQMKDPNTTIVMHNASFDLTVLKHGLGIELPLERVHCTMAQARAHSLPGSLGTLCEILGVPVEDVKDKAGKALIRLFCLPRPKNMKIRRATRDTHPEEWQQFIDYAKADISATRAIYNRLPKWNYRESELALWQLDRRINARGFAVDGDLVRGAIRSIDAAQKSLSARALEITNGALRSTTQRDAFLKYIEDVYAIVIPDGQGATLEVFLDNPNTPAAMRELLANRLQSTTSSTAKYKKLHAAVSSDGRMRGTLEFCGAARTGRWSGKTFQPQNLPRANMKNDDIELGIRALKAGCEGLMYEKVLELASNAIRGVIVAPKGKKLVVSDLSNIEGRVAAWLAGETWKLQAFRDFDTGKGADLYKLAYAKAFRITPEEVTKDQRQIGKVMELMLQYSGGTGAFLTGAAAYGIDLDNLAVVAMPTIPKETLEKSNKTWDWAVKEKRTYDLSHDAYVVCDALKLMWRSAHPAISSYWRELEDKIVQAICQPGATLQARKIKIRRDGAWLRVVLPSGRALCYVSPKVDEKNKISYKGVNQFTRKWDTISTYSGKVFENICQAVARDVMAYAMLNVDTRGYDIVLTCHDELITEAPDTADYSHEHLSTLLATPPVWAEDLPLAAAGFSSYRYKKG